MQRPNTNGDGELRTLDPLLARQVLSQLSYTPIWMRVYPVKAIPIHFSVSVSSVSTSQTSCFIFCLAVGLSGLEPPTSRLSGVRSNRLSYKPFWGSGTHLLSHIVSNIVSSAAYVLTVVFGMGTGVSHRRIGTGISQNLLYQSSIAPPKAPLFSVAVAPLMHLRRVIRSRKQASIASATPHLRNRLLVIEDSTVYKTLTSSSLERR